MTDLIVEEMTCGGCASAVTRAVQRIDSTAKVDVNLQTKQVKIDSTQPVDKLIEVIADAGFPAHAA